MVMQQAPRPIHSARRRIWPRRAILVGGDSVVTRALQVYLRKEGWDAATVSDDPASWVGELTARPGPPIPFAAASVIVLAPVITGQRRLDLCRSLRADPHLGAIPIIALRDAGDDVVSSSSSSGAVGGAVVRLTANGADPLMECVDASVAWPFRLREVLGTVDALIDRSPHAVSA
jgi:hypothetical protein